MSLTVGNNILVKMGSNSKVYSISSDGTLNHLQTISNLADRGSALAPRTLLLSSASFNIVSLHTISKSKADNIPLVAVTSTGKENKY